MFKELVKPVAQPVQVMEGMIEYEHMCAHMGVQIEALQNNKFLQFMSQLDLPVYDHATVVKYMDRIAARDGNGLGWLWRPLRDEDRSLCWHNNIRFGTPPKRKPIFKQPSSDWFQHDKQIRQYNKPVPLRVLKRAQTLLQYPGTTILFVSDYTIPEDKKTRVLPDPFLMVYLLGLGGKGRFIVDFWDEPGFGLEEMLAGTPAQG